jgi:hypothetical protein
MSTKFSKQLLVTIFLMSRNDCTVYTSWKYISMFHDVIAFQPMPALLFPKIAVCDSIVAITSGQSAVVLVHVVLTNVTAV